MPIEEMTPLDEHDPAFEALHKEIRERAAELGERRGLPEEVVHQVLDSVTDPGRFADLVAGYIELSVAEKQGLLETLSVEERLRRVLVHVQRQIGLLEAQEEIKSQVQEELGERQREMYLREQLKAIQKELGDDDQAREVAELREKLDEARAPQGGPRRSRARARDGWSAPAASRWKRRSSARISNGSPSCRGTRAPTTSSTSRTPSRCSTTTTTASQDVKDRVLEFLAVRQLRAKQLAEELETTGELPAAKLRAEQGERDAVARRERGRGPARSPTRRKPRPARWRRARSCCSSGRPASARRRSPSRSPGRSGREYVRVALGGARDEADIRGHRRTYVGAMPGRIIQGMKQAGTKNPVFLLDEVDKLGASFQGDPAAALLEVLDPAQNDTFTDHYLGVPFDLSEVLFIATANFIQNIPGPLLDRMEVVDFAGYTEREKAEIAKKYLIPRQLEEAGLADKDVDVHGRGGRWRSCSQYTRESGVRQLERQVGAVARKVARKLAAGEADGTRDHAPRTSASCSAGRGSTPSTPTRRTRSASRPGMYYTPMGGDIMFVEAAIRRLYGAAAERRSGRRSAGWGNVSLILTGQLGDVMKESARAALDVRRDARVATRRSPRTGSARSRSTSTSRRARFPRTGRRRAWRWRRRWSARCRAAPVRRDVAMTGEITLRGRVLPIGGVKEKVLGAHRAGITTIILPQGQRGGHRGHPGGGPRAR